MFPRSGSVSTGSTGTGGGTVTNPTNPTPTTGTSDATIQAWIRGTGLFRRVASVMGDTTMDDFHWQSFIVLPGLAFLGGSSTTTLKVVKPTATLTSQITPFSTPSSPMEWNNGLSPPQGAWTLLFVPDTNVTVTLRFEETAHFVYGYNGSTGQAISATTPTSISIPARRMVFLMLLGSNDYYVHIF